MVTAPCFLDRVQWFDLWRCAGRSARGGSIATRLSDLTPQVHGAILEALAHGAPGPATDRSAATPERNRRKYPLHGSPGIAGAAASSLLHA